MRSALSYILITIKSVKREELKMSTLTTTKMSSKGQVVIKEEAIRGGIALVVVLEFELGMPHRRKGEGGRIHSELW
jgi:hypothetical protein